MSGLAKLAIPNGGFLFAYFALSFSVLCHVESPYPSSLRFLLIDRVENPHAGSKSSLPM